MRHSLNNLLIASLLLVGHCATSLADDFHYKNTLIGDRAAGLGGAYTAVSDDPSGLFYNPAGIVYSENSNMTASMNSYQQTTLTYEDVLGNKHDWNRSSSTLMPNFFGIVQPLDDFMVGFSYALPNSSLEDQDQVFPNITSAIDRFIINFNNDDTTYNFGPSVAFSINDSVSIGATLYVHLRNQQRTSNILIEYGSGARYWSNEYYELEEQGIKPILGVMWSPLDKLSLAASISQTFVTESTLTRYDTCEGAQGITYSASSFCQSSQINHRILTDTSKADYPLNLNLGFAYFHDKSLMLSGEINVYDEVVSDVAPKEAVVNISAGVEYYLNPRNVLRVGFFTDMANTPELQNNVTSYNQAEHIDLFGLSASLGRFTRTSSLSIGISYAYGEGKAQMVAGDPTLQNATLESTTIFISASGAL